MIRLNSSITRGPSVTVKYIFLKSKVPRAGQQANVHRQVTNEANTPISEILHPVVQIQSQAYVPSFLIILSFL